MSQHNTLVHVDHVESARLVKEAFLDSEFEVYSIDWKTAGLYLTLTTPREELGSNSISHLVPMK